MYYHMPTSSVEDFHCCLCGDKLKEEVEILSENEYRITKVCPNHGEDPNKRYKEYNGDI